MALFESNAQHICAGRWGRHLGCALTWEGCGESQLQKPQCWSRFGCHEDEFKIEMRVCGHGLSELLSDRCSPGCRRRWALQFSISCVCVRVCVLMFACMGVHQCCDWGEWNQSWKLQLFCPGVLWLPAKGTLVILTCINQRGNKGTGDWKLIASPLCARNQWLCTQVWLFPCVATAVGWLMFQAARVPPKGKSQEAKQALVCALLFSGFQFQSSCLCCCVLDVHCVSRVEPCITNSPICSSTSVLVFGYVATEGCKKPRMWH